jgi:phosphatidylinositol alpha-mannosyltransferase
VTPPAGGAQAPGGLRIAITNPYCWPEVRRGSERLLHELSHYMAARGHDVTVISSAVQGVGEARDGAVRRIVLPHRKPPLPANRWFNDMHMFAFGVRAVLQREAFDVVHALSYHDAFGALMARRRGARMRIGYHMVGIPMPGMFRTRPLDRLMYSRAVHGADTVLTVSRFAQRMMREAHGVQSAWLPSPTDTSVFARVAKPAPDGTLRLLFAGDTTEPRKGLVLLARALARVRRLRPDAQLLVSGRAPQAVMDQVLAAVPQDCRGAIRFLGVGAVEDLPALYASATLFVLPSAWEAQGMVLVEALAAGTPVVACDHGGVKDIVTDPRIGRLFAPGEIVHRLASNDAGLADAILAAAELAARPETEPLCREHAARFGWAVHGPRYEAVMRGEPIEGCAATADCAMAAPCGNACGNE